jgi:hypothetical protein
MLNNNSARAVHDMTEAFTLVICFRRQVVKKVP